MRYIRMNLTQYSDGYSCVAIETSYEDYRYTRKYFRHYYYELSDRKIVLLTSSPIEKYQANNLINHYVRGKFHREDTANWD